MARGKNRPGQPLGNLLPEELVRGTGIDNPLVEVYNDSEDITAGQGNPIDLGVRAPSTNPEAGRLATKKERRAATHITPMQEIFIAVYVATRDKNRAAVEAGYAPGFAPIMAKRLLNGVYYPLVANKIKSLLQEQQKVAVMDGAAVLKYVHTILQFQPAMWFMPGDDGGWLMEMDDVRVLPSDLLSIVEHIEMKTIESPDGTKTNKMWVKFVSKTQALAIAARYQLGDLNKDTTPVVQIDWSKLFGRGPVTLTQTTTQVSVSGTKRRSKALSISPSDHTSTAEDGDYATFPPEGLVEDDEVERRIIEVEATAPAMTATEKVKALMNKKGKK